MLKQVLQALANHVDVVKVRALGALLLSVHQPPAFITSRVRVIAEAVTARGLHQKTSTMPPPSKFSVHRKLLKQRPPQKLF